MTTRPFGRVDARREELIRAQAERSSLFVRDINQMYSRFRGIDLDDPLGGVREFIDTLAVPKGRRGDPSGVFNFGSAPGLPEPGAWDWENELFARSALRERDRADVGDELAEGLERSNPKFRLYRYRSAREAQHETESILMDLAVGFLREQKGPRREGEGEQTHAESPYDAAQREYTDAAEETREADSALAEAQRAADDAQGEYEKVMASPDASREQQDEAFVKLLGAQLAVTKAEQRAEEAAESEAEKAAIMAYELDRQIKKKGGYKKDSPRLELAFVPPTEAGELIRREQARRENAILAHRPGGNPFAANVAEGAPSSERQDIAPRPNRAADPTGLGARDPRAEAEAARRPDKPDYVSRPAGESDAPSVIEPGGSGRRPQTPTSIWSRRVMR